jgi:FAD/FMN-containing dehydrogenase
MNALIEHLAAVVGHPNVLTAPADVEPYVLDWRGVYRGATPAVVRPGNTEEVAAVMKLCAEAKAPVVPQGGNTGMCMASVPRAGRHEIVLSLGRMNHIRKVDPLNNTMTAEAGVGLANLQQAAAEADRLFPLSLGAEGSCTIGGNLSTNAGGIAALVHGISRQHAVGLEVVLADGRVLNNLNKLKKDNTGYDLKNLFIGAEGTLGIITAAVLKLVPKPRSVETAYAAVLSPQAAVELLGIAQARLSGGVTSFEMMARNGIEAVITHDSASRDPLAKVYPWYVLIEVSSQQRTGLREALEELLAEGVDKGLVLDATFAESLEQAKAFWRIRELFGEVQRHIGASIKHDISVPIAQIPAFIKEADKAVADLIPGTTTMPFGHVGDGNIHYNAMQPPGMTRQEFLNRWDDVNQVVFAVVKKYNGSISAEHGVGVMKRDILHIYKDPVALDLMRGIKQLLDPNGILNPGKVLPQ